MSLGLHVAFLVVVIAGVIVGLITDNWNAAIGLAIAWVFFTFLEIVDPS